MFYLNTGHFQVENTMALSYLMKVGGTRSREIKTLAKEISKFTLSQKIIITAEYLPGKLNVRANWASKNFSEWMLSPMQKISGNWSTPEINLFASICFPYFLTDRKSSLKSQRRGINSDFGNSKLACTTLVQSNLRPVHNRASSPAPTSGFFGKSQGASTSSSVEQDFKTNGLENFRKNLVEKGISNTAANLILDSRRSDTTANYQSVWKKWVSWCSERQIDPVTCSMNFVLNFLGNLFENKHEYSSINSHRSAISAYHNLVEGKPVEQHISVCNLMTSVFNKNP